MDEKVAVEALRQVKEILDKQAIEYWLDMGTLLGAVRDGKLIPWDSDIDIGVWNKDFDRVSAACIELREKEFKIYVGIGSLSIFKYENESESLISVSSYLLDNNNQAKKMWLLNPKESYHNGIKIVKRKTQLRLRIILKYLLWLLSDPICYGDSPRFIPYKFQVILLKISGTLPAYLRECLSNLLLSIFKKFGFQYFYLQIPSHYFKNLTIMYFYGMEFKVPSPVERYLEYRYGKDWRTPKEDYIYYRDDGAIARNKK